MKILHLNCNYVHTQLHRVMVHHLSSMGIDNTVFCPIFSQTEKEDFQIEPNEHVEVCFEKSDRLFFFLKQSKIIKRVKKVVDVGEYDIIHAYTLMTDGNVARKLSMQSGVPYVVAVRDTDVNAFFRLKPYLRPLGVQIMKDAVAVFFLSEAYRKHVIKNIVPKQYQAEIEHKAFVIPNGIDGFWLKNRFYNRNYSSIIEQLDKRCVKIVCVGRINKRKNIPIIQSALSQMREKGWHTNLEIIGKVEDNVELEKIRRDKYTEVFPPTDKEGLIDHYRNADIFALASHTETFGLVYAEAMSQSLPVVYTKGQGFDGHFPNGEVGFSVSDTDPVEIANAIKCICENYKEISNNAVEKCLRFDWNKICMMYKSLYEHILEE